MARLAAVRLLCAALMAAATALPAAAQTWTASHQFPAEDPRNDMLRSLAADLERVGINLRIFPAATLVRPRDQWPALVDGKLDMIQMTVEYLTDPLPVLGALALPGLVTSHDSVRRLSASPVMKEVRAKLERAGAIVIADIWIAVAMGSTRQCVMLPSNLKSLRTRASGPGFATLWKAAGAAPVTGLGSDTLHSLLGSNLIEALDTTTASMQHYRLYERLACVTVPGDFAIAFTYQPVMLSKKSWDKLDDPKRQAVLEAGRRAEQAFFETSRAIDSDMAKAFAEKGVQVRTLSPEQAEAWTALARRSSWRDFTDRVPGGKEMLGKVLAVK